MVKIKQTIGFIGQGWIGKNYADDFENRGYDVVRYALEEPYANNRYKVRQCKIVFIAVPTPTTTEGFSAEFVIDALTNLSKGTIAVIKSTMQPGRTDRLQQLFPDLYVLHSPEFLREKTAKYDVEHPERNIIGIPIDDYIFAEKARIVMELLPRAKYEKVMSAKEAELVKYAGNCLLYSKVIFMNILYDLVIKSEADYSIVREALVADSRVGESHTDPVHNSGHDESEVKSKRGAGGHCFIKDFESFRRLYKEKVNNESASELLSAMVKYNNHLLLSTKKDVDLLEEVYGKV
ncbi:hypothetical protein KC851_02300 [Candidatus Kaiserbacteria bacterium]|nr:hypothetical protein [Candidatus Kaiserbacteria bacterium]